MRAACRPDPMRIAWWLRRLLRVRSSSPGRPSQPPLRGPASAWRAAISRLRKPLRQLARAPLGTGRDRRHEGRFARAPRPRLPPERTPPGASISTRPVSAVSPSSRAITAMILCFTAQAVGLDPETAAEFHRRDAVLRRHDQVDGGNRVSAAAWLEDRARRGRCLLLAPVALIETPTASTQCSRWPQQGQTKIRPGAAGPAPRGTAPWCRRPPETPRRSDHARAM